MKRGLILFIHGLNGNDETWYNKEIKKYFKDILKENFEIDKNYDLEHFNYDSKISYFKIANGAVNLLKSIMDGKTKKDLNIKDIAGELKTYLEYNVKKDNYNEIIIIAHSMGGMIAKEYILKNNEDLKIKLCFFLGSPQQGSIYAIISKLPGTSKFLEDLTPNSPQIKNTNSRWIKSKNLPKTFYIEGNHDIYVNEISSYNYEGEHRINGVDYKYIKTKENHSSICKPSRGDYVHNIIESEIIKNLNFESIEEREPFIDNNQYDRMIFVLKMIAANVMEETIDQSKLSYYHFESIYRELTQVEKKKLAKYSDKIKDLYLTKYTLFKKGDIKDSTSLILNIKEELKKEDQNYYYFEHKLIEHLEKFGLLHSLADRDEKIIWAK